MIREKKEDKQNADIKLCPQIVKLEIRSFK